MIIIAKTIAENGKIIEHWEFEHDGSWNDFVEVTKEAEMLTSYYRLDKIENGVMIFNGKYADEEYGVLVRTYQAK